MAVIFIIILLAAVERNTPLRQSISCRGCSMGVWETRVWGGVV